MFWNNINKKNSNTIAKLFSLFVFLCLSVFFLGFLEVRSASSPSVLNYQAKLLVDGQSATTTQSIIFSIYNASSGGSILYTATGTIGSPAALSVSPSSGVFSVALGGSGTNVIDPTIFKDNGDLYLQVTVGGEALTPRKQIYSVPFALNSRYLEGLVATSTPTSTAYVPVADASGNVNFNHVTSTGGYISGNLTVNTDLLTSGNVTTTGGQYIGGTLRTIGVSTLGITTMTSSTMGVATTTGGHYVGGNLSVNSNALFNGLITATGTFGVGDSPVYSGAGTRMMWYPKKAAFRVGTVTNNEFDDNQIGNYSAVVGGYNNGAQGAYASVLGGAGNTASGTYSGILSGSDNLAVGSRSVVLGGASNYSYSDNSVLMGRESSLLSAASNTFAWAYYDEGGNILEISQPNSAIFYNVNGIKFGIDTITPQYTLDVNGTLRAVGTSTLGITTMTSSTMGVATTTGDHYIGGNLTVNSNALFNGLITATGTFGVGDDIVFGGTGTRMMWYPKKAAFRVGMVATLGGEGSPWDDVAIGNYSAVVGGVDGTASGAYATVLGGITNVANSTYASVVGGQENWASATSSVVIGGRGNVVATGANDSFIGGGVSSTINSVNSVVFGKQAELLTSATNTFGWIYSEVDGVNGTVSQPNSAIFYNSNGIKFGIDTLAPQFTLDVNGTLRAVGTSTLGITTMTSSTMGIATTTGDHYVGGNLSVNNNALFSGLITATGTFGVGDSPVYSGAGTRMMWYPKKAAFRVGDVTGSQWDDANIGDYSVALGRDGSATSSYSSILGGRNNSVGSTYGVILGGGQNSITSDAYAGVILGGTANTIGYGEFGAILAGSGSSIYADNSVVIGRRMSVSSTAANSFMMGYNAGSVVEVVDPNVGVFYNSNGIKIGIDQLSPQYTLDVNGTFHAVGEATLGVVTMTSSTMGIATTTGNHYIGGNLTVNGNSLTSGNATTTGVHYFGGNVTANSNFFVGGNATTTGQQYIGWSLLLNNDLLVSGNASTTGVQYVGGAFRANGTALINGVATLNSSVSVAGTSNFVGNVAIGTSTVSESSLLIAGGDIYQMFKRPVLMGTYSFGAFPPNHLEVVGKNVFVSVGNNYKVLDVSNPSAVDMVGIVFSVGDAKKFIVEGRSIYSPEYSSDQVGKIDISDKTTMVASTIVTDSSNLNGVYDLAKKGNYLYAVSYIPNSDFVSVIDLNSQTLINTTTIGVDGSGCKPKSITLSNDFAYTVCGVDGGLDVLNVSNPRVPLKVHSLEDADLDYASDIKVIGGFAYVVTGIVNEKLLIYDVRSSTAPIQTSLYSVESGAGIDNPKLDYANGYLYVTKKNGFTILNVSDPSNPTYVTEFTSTTGLTGDISIAVSGKSAYVTAVDSTNLFIFDLSGLITPSALVGSVSTGKLHVSDNAEFENKLSVGNSLTIGEGGLATVGDFSMINSTTNTLDFKNTAVFTNTVSDSSGSQSFVLNAQNYSTSTASDRYVLSLRSNSVPVFSVAGNGDTRALGTMYAASSDVGTPGTPGDLAERVDIAPGETDVSPGDVMVVDTGNTDTYRRSSSAYETAIAGVVSTNPTIIVGDSRTEYSTVLAMIGRVPVNVSSENGAIKSGDILVSGAKKGYAAKYVASLAPVGEPIGVVGIALEDLSASEGKILVLVRSGWVLNQSGESIQTVQSQTMPVSGGFSGLSVVDGPNGKILEANTNIDMRGFAFLNVGKIQGRNENWSIDEKGIFVLRLATSGGSKDFYGMVSPDSELVFSGSGTLVSGTADVKFSEDVASIIDHGQPIKVNITLTSGGANGVFVETKDAVGFKVRELQSGSSNASFDWMVIARRKSGEEIDQNNNLENVETENSGTSTIVVVSDVVSSSTEEIITGADSADSGDTSSSSAPQDSVVEPDQTENDSSLVTNVSDQDSSVVENNSGDSAVVVDSIPEEPVIIPSVENTSMSPEVSNEASIPSTE